MGDKLIKIDCGSAYINIIWEAVQKKLNDIGVIWGGGDKVLPPPHEDKLCLEWMKDEKRWKMCYGTADLGGTYITSADKVLSGEFDIKKWMDDNTPKKEPTRFCYCIDLSWVKGTAREVISEAIQKKAFEKGYKWRGIRGATIAETDAPALYIENRCDKNTGCILHNYEWHPEYMRDPDHAELSVNRALRGEYPSAK